MPSKHLISKVTLLFLALVFITSSHRYAKWSDNIVGGGDGWGYYLYLPAIFIYGDLDDLSESIKVRKSYHSGYNSPDKAADHISEAHLQDNGNRVAKYTIGMSILYLPFFLLAHLIASIGPYTADGYSIVYRYIMALATVFFALWGCVLLRKVLLQWVSDRACSITLLIIGLGTNLYYFTVYNSPMAHAGLFFLYALLIYATQHWYTRQRLKDALLVGFSAGLITLIRPTEIICLLIPLLWGIHSWSTFLGRFKFIGKHLKAYGLSAVMYILAGLPQLIYWKWISGHWLFYSYGEEGFDFANPHLVEGLFGFRNGWLAYTPLMALGILGIYFLFRRRHAALLPVLVFMSIHIYITYSWWCWYYINGFGSRPMVETYALMSIPLAFFIQKIITAPAVVKYLGFGVIALFCWQNMFQTYQVSAGLQWTQGSNWAFYKRSFGKKQLSYLDLVTLDTGITPPDESALKKIATLGYLDFEDSLSTHYKQGIPGNDSGVFRLDNKKQFSPDIRKKISEIDGLQAGDWVKISVDAMRQYQGNYLYRCSILVFSAESGKFWNGARLDNKLGNVHHTVWAGKANVWDNVYFWMQIPKDIESHDVIKCGVWNSMAPVIYIDNLKMELWRK